MKLNIGIVGLGTVGSGLIELIEKNKNQIKKIYNIELKIIGIHAKSKSKKRSFNKGNYKWFANHLKMIEDSSIQLIVELVGGANGIALDIAKKTLNSGKNLVTANKAMIAIHGNKLIALAEKNKVNISFEASVAGGIPVINVLENSLLADKISKIYGILNGTSNYILTQMLEKKKSFDSVLKNAQALGYAEFDPTDDVSGRDAAYKISILSNLVFSIPSKFSDVEIKGINTIENIDLSMADKLGYSIKLIGLSEKFGTQIIQKVQPCLVLKESIISKVKNELNTIVIEGNLADKIVLTGKGAGKYPTSSAVISDIIDFRKNKKRRLISYKTEKVKSMQKTKLKYSKEKFYIRLKVMDKPGVLADITSLFKKQKISISSMFQMENKKSTAVPLIFMTHNVDNRELVKAIYRIEKLENVKSKAIIIKIEESL